MTLTIFLRRSVWPKPMENLYGRIIFKGDYILFTFYRNHVHGPSITRYQKSCLRWEQSLETTLPITFQQKTFHGGVPATLNLSVVKIAHYQCIIQTVCIKIFHNYILYWPNLRPPG